MKANPAQLTFAPVENHERAGATFNVARTHRLRLWRAWDHALPRGAFVMLNPSVAGAVDDDHTIRRCRTLAAAWGWGGFDVCNLWSMIATDPRDLFAAVDAGAPSAATDDNDSVLAWLGSHIAPTRLVVAWGKVPRALGRIDRVFQLLGQPREVGAIELLPGLWPRHPSRAPNTPRVVGYDLGAWLADAERARAAKLAKAAAPKTRGRHAATP